MGSETGDAAVRPYRGSNALNGFFSSNPLGLLHPELHGGTMSQTSSPGSTYSRQNLSPMTTNLDRKDLNVPSVVFL
jgi:hypothetical protein